MTKSQRGGSLAAVVKEALVPLLLLGAQDKVKNKNVFLNKLMKKTKRKRLKKRRTKKRRTMKKYRKRRRKSRRRRRRR
tara:strand:- start:300 stop:533 length:234 start_codon:yes stop_codon:yes gene_type:complete